ncbi:MAG: peptidoglycan editing factor PgeF [Pontibacterium sp.]
MIKLITPNWPAPPNVKACASTRLGGVSQGVFESLNLGDHVDDDPYAVAENRKRLLACVNLEQAQWLQQVHGTDCVSAQGDGVVRQADACFSNQANLACIVMTADCLPVLFCNKQGTQVAAAHAGWRGLAGGVLEQTLATFSPQDEILAWLGPAIGPSAFEVGDDVRDVFCAHFVHAEDAFVAHAKSAGKWWGNLYQLARLVLNQSGVTHIYGGDHCTFTDRQHFFSYRRDGQTGRMASLIWLSSRA